MKNCVSHFMLPHHSAVVSYEKLPLCPPAWWLVPTMHETTLRKGGCETVRENRVGTMVTLVSDRQRMVSIKVAYFQTRVCTSTGSPQTKTHVFCAGERRISGHQLEKSVCYCHFLFDKLGLSSSAFQHACPCLKNSCPHTTVDRYGNIQAIFIVHLLGQKPVCFCLWCFHSSRAGQWLGSSSFYSLWVTELTAPSVLQEFEGK